MIDTPGMRELQLWNSEAGAERAFADIAALARGCKFRDCAHCGEPGCAIAAAIQRGLLRSERLGNYHKLLAELHFEERKVNSAAARQDKEKWKKIHQAMRKRPAWF